MCEANRKLARISYPPKRGGGNQIAAKCGKSHCELVGNQEYICVRK